MNLLYGLGYSASIENKIETMDAVVIPSYLNTGNYPIEQPINVNLNNRVVDSNFDDLFFNETSSGGIDSGVYDIEGNETDKYCLISFENRSSHTTVKYSLKWSGGSSKNHTIEDGYCRWHSFKCNSGKKKDVEVTFDYDMTDGIGWKSYDLTPKITSHKTCEDSSKYRFKDKNGNKIDLYSFD